MRFDCVQQDAFNLLPNLNMEELARSFAVKSNDMMLVIYLSSMIRSVLALHDLIDNREGAGLTLQMRSMWCGRWLHFLKPILDNGNRGGMWC